jgi:hypothetical protein
MMRALGFSLMTGYFDQHLGNIITYIDLHAAQVRHALCGIHLALSTCHNTYG